MIYFAHPHLNTHILTHSHTFFFHICWPHILFPHLLSTHSFSTFVAPTFFSTMIYYLVDLVESRKFIGTWYLPLFWTSQFPSTNKKRRPSVCFHVILVLAVPEVLRAWGCQSPVAMEVISRNWYTNAFPVDFNILHWVGSGGRVHAVIIPTFF